ncbi:hypothetical protein X757_16955 [Mesorhizobium sp. LSHC414A00]|nr:hypothetical protein X757_16955 [Mesorhizobium sp. LSHC414A00]
MPKCLVRLYTSIIAATFLRSDLPRQLKWRKSNTCVKLWFNSSTRPVYEGFDAIVANITVHSVELRRASDTEASVTKVARHDLGAVV